MMTPTSLAKGGPARVARSRQLIALGLLFFIACGASKTGAPPHGVAAGGATSSGGMTSAAGDGSGGAPLGGPESGEDGVATTVIGADGGELVFGRIRLLVPAGALQAAQVIQVTARAVDPNAVPSEDDALGQIYDFQPDGLTFAKAAMLTIAREDGTDGVSNDDLVIASSDAGSTDWTALDSWLTDSGVGALVDHFSKKALRRGKRHCSHPCAPCEACDKKTGACKPWPSSTPLDDCGTKQCFELRFDHDHCGTCDHACGPDEICDVGECTCRCLGADGSCSDLPPLCHADERANPRSCGCVCKDPRKTPCGETRGPGDTVCTDLTTDAANCGACGNQCDPDQECKASSCACKNGKQRCEGVCLDASSDHGNCGSCGHACAIDEVCVDSSCECPTGQKRCNGTCTDLERDRTACGECDNHCPEEQVCQKGRCQCPDGLSPCSGRCVNLVNDIFNCGTCDTHCTADQNCSDSACQCADPKSNCGGTCTDVSTDPKNCGHCGDRCQGGESCTAGSCACSVQGTWTGGCWDWFFASGTLTASCPTDSSCTGSYTNDPFDPTDPARRGIHFHLGCTPSTQNGSPAHTDDGTCTVDTAGCGSIACSYTYAITGGSTQGSASWSGTRSSK